jgi:hypothetical protein
MTPLLAGERKWKKPRLAQNLIKYFATIFQSRKAMNRFKFKKPLLKNSYSYLNVVAKAIKIVSYEFHKNSYYNWLCPRCTEAEHSIHTPTTDEGFNPTTVSGRQKMAV